MNGLTEKDYFNLRNSFITPEIAYAAGLPHESDLEGAEIFIMHYAKVGEVLNAYADLKSPRNTLNTWEGRGMDESK